MKERISQLAAGTMDFEAPELELLKPQIEEIVVSGQNFRGDIRISSGNRRPFRGLVYSDDSRVQLLQNSFAGTSINIPYEVKAELLEAGTELSGSFCLVYNGGEHKIPYLFRIRRSGSGRQVEVETLKAFAQMAKERPAEARELFDSRDFMALPFMEDMSVRAIYDGLHRAVNRKNSMEEFLIATGVKKRIHFQLTGVEDESQPLEFSLGKGNLPGSLEILRSGWGNLELQISSDHPALSFQKDTWTENDFSGDRLMIPLLFDEKQFHAGINYVRVTVESLLEKHTVSMKIRRSSSPSLNRKKRHEKRESELEFYRTLLDVLAVKEDSGEKLEYLQLCWESLTAEEEPSPRQKLYRAAIGWWREDTDLARMILEDVQREIQAGRREDPDAYCGYLYLDMKVNGGWEQKEQLIKILQHYQETMTESIFRFLLRLHLDEGAVDRPREILHQIQTFCEEGCHSPFLYLEAVRIYNRHPDVIRRIGDFECQILHFGARRGFLAPQTISYISGLAVQMRNYSPNLLEILKLLYAAEESDEVLGGICAQLIKGELREPKYFPWFEEGVKRDLRITRLYDYFLYTAPEEDEGPFPREIILYFSYNSPRDPESQKLLYGNLLRHYPQDPQIMESYQIQLRDYVQKGILSQSMDRDMAFIYEQMLELSDVNERNARILPDLLYTREICCDNPSCTEAIVVYGELEEELSVPMKDGRAYLPVYSESCRFLLAGNGGTRFAAEGCQVRQLLDHTDALVARCREVNPRHPMLRLAECSHILEKKIKTESMLRTLRRELDVREIHRQFRRALIRAIVAEAIRRKPPVGEEILTCVHYSGVPAEQRAELTRILIDLGRYSEAGRQIAGIGFRQLPVESVRQLADMTIQNSLYVKDEQLIDICRYLFEQNQCDDLILEYLCTHLGASSQEMLPVLKKAHERGVQTGDMAERLLGQMLFTGMTEGMDEVFRIYMSQDRQDTLLVHAYFVVKCSAWFLQDQPADDEVFSFVERQLTEDTSGNTPQICVLAWLKYLSTREQLTPTQKELGERLLADLLQEDIAFGWMKDLEGKLWLPEEIRRREWIEYRGEPGDSLELRLTILPEMKDRTPLRLPLPEIYPGIFNKPVLLFDGDECRYEILRAESGEVLKKGRFFGKPSGEEDVSRFANLNRLQMKVRGQYRVQDVQQAVMSYAVQDTWIESMFTV